MAVNGLLGFIHAELLSSWLNLLIRDCLQSPGVSEGGYFCSIDQILESSETPQLKLLAKAAASCLPLVCDTKEAGGDTFFRLNDDLVLAWLLVKLPMVQEALEGVLGGMDEDARVAYCLGFLVGTTRGVLCSHVELRHCSLNLNL